MRIWELAKELNVDNKEIFGIAKKLKIPVKSPLNSLDEEQEVAVREYFNANKKSDNKHPKKERISKPERSQEKKDYPKKTEPVSQKEVKKPEKVLEKTEHKKNNEKASFDKKDVKREQKFERIERKTERDEKKAEYKLGKNKKIKPKGSTEEKPDRYTGDKKHSQRPQKDRRDRKFRRHRGHEREETRSTEKIVRERPIEVVIPISIKDFSQAIGVRANLIITKLVTSHGIKVNLNQSLTEEQVEAIGLEFNKNIKIKKGEDPEETLLKSLEAKDSPESLVPRAPVVTFLGHVDHGKTSLMDKIRKTNVTAQEAGGITQHIGAYKVSHKGQSIVFLDTPGHEAFTSMRARGANITDIVVLVVAADDGVMPQTVEAINHAKAAGVPIVVALNKVDKPSAKIDATTQQLSRYELLPEAWGGETVFVEVSAITGQGIHELLEYLLLVAEMQELRANPKRKALGTVIEARVMEGRGIVATLLVQNGTLKRGGFILCGSGYGRVRDLLDHNGKKLKEAGPSTPVEICGLSSLPEAGDKFYVVENLAKAKEVADTRKKDQKEQSLARGSRKLSLEEIMKQIQEGAMKELRLVLKADVQGSVEALSAKLAEISHEEIKVKVLHAAVGGINETDVQLAYASEAIVIGFSVTPNKSARDLAEDKGIEIKRYTVIYHLLDDIKKIMSGMLTPETQEKITGHITVRKVIRISKYGNIAGCYVTDGTIERNSKIRISRDGVLLNKGKPLTLSSLKRFKEDVTKVKEGFECGIKLEGFEDIKEGDDLEAFQIVEVARTLE